MRCSDCEKDCSGKCCVCKKPICSKCRTSFNCNGARYYTCSSCSYYDVLALRDKKFEPKKLNPYLIG